MFIDLNHRASDLENTLSSFHKSEKELQSIEALAKAEITFEEANPEICILDEEEQKRSEIYETLRTLWRESAVRIEFLKAPKERNFYKTFVLEGFSAISMGYPMLPNKLAFEVANFYWSRLIEEKELPKSDTHSLVEEMVYHWNKDEDLERLLYRAMKDFEDGIYTSSELVLATSIGIELSKDDSPVTVVEILNECPKIK